MNSARNTSLASIIPGILIEKTFVITTALLLPLLAGCGMNRETTLFTLDQPTPPMVVHRVNKGDQLQVDLRNGSTQTLEVGSVDAATIVGKDGASISIEDVSQLRCVDTETITDGLVQSTVLTGLLVTSIYWIPIGLPIVLLQDKRSADKWPEDALCRTDRHPEQYGYSELGVSTVVKDAATLEEVRAEIEARKLSCDATSRAEKRCAFMYTSGHAFTRCVSIVADMERTGLAEITDWDSNALCETAQNRELLEAVTLWPAGPKIEELVQAARQVVDAIGLECPESLGTPGYVPLFH